MAVNGVSPFTAAHHQQVWGGYHCGIMRVSRGMPSIKENVTGAEVVADSKDGRHTNIELS